MGSDNKQAGHGLRSSDLLELKQLNARLTTLQNVVQDYSQEMMPSWISLSTTSFCNLRCPHCQTHGTDEIHKLSNSQTWPKDLVTRLADETLPYAFEFNLGLNGEPLATPHLRQRLREFGKYGAKLHLTTNGTLLSKKTIARVLPVASQVHISIDGATEATCEAIRLDSNFKKLLHNIKLLTRAYELLPEKSPIGMALAFTVMASNVREMPEMVRMADFLKIPTVNFYNLAIFFPHVRGEDLRLYKPLYNAYRERAQHEADCLGISVYMPDAFPGVSPDANVKVSGPNLIATSPAQEYYSVPVQPERESERSALV